MKKGFSYRIVTMRGHKKIVNISMNDQYQRVSSGFKRKNLVIDDSPIVSKAFRKAVELEGVEVA